MGSICHRSNCPENGAIVAGAFIVKYRSNYRRSNYRRSNSRRSKFRRSNCRRRKFRRSICRGAIIAFIGAILLSQEQLSPEHYVGHSIYAIGCTIGIMRRGGGGGGAGVLCPHPQAPNTTIVSYFGKNSGDIRANCAIFGQIQENFWLNSGKEGTPTHPPPQKKKTMGSGPLGCY